LGERRDGQGRESREGDERRFPVAGTVGHRKKTITLQPVSFERPGHPAVGWVSQLVAQSSQLQKAPG
jgi:hypothetical protein